MKKLFILAMAVIFVLSMGTGAIGQNKKEEPASSEKTKPEVGKPKVVKENVVKVQAKVEAIDLTNRVVTLRLPNGHLADIKVDERVKNLSQVKVGDAVVAKYHESVAVQVVKSGEPGGTTMTETLTPAKPGEKPGAVVTRKMTVTATIEDISPKKTYVTLKGPEGKTKKVKIQDPKILEKVKIGDQVAITFTEALAMSVEKAKKK